MNAWQQEQQEQQANLVATLESIATELGSDWRVETPHDHSARLVSDSRDGLTIWARVETYGAQSGRLKLSAGTPDGANYSAGDTHGIDGAAVTVAMTRTPAAIARDMERRLIGPAVDYWTAVRERIARRLSALSARETLARELADIMHGEARETRGDWRAETPDALRHGKLYTYGHMSPDYAAEDVTVELRNLSPDRARELARLIASWGA